MRKVASLMPVLMLTCALAFGQARTLSGRVTDAQGNPVPFASITVKGANTTLRIVAGCLSIHWNGSLHTPLAPPARTWRRPPQKLRSPLGSMVAPLTLLRWSFPKPAAIIRVASVLRSGG